MERKTIIIRDMINLPQLGWGDSFMGPVLHPTKFGNDIIKKLLNGNPPVKFVFAVNPKDKKQKVQLNNENYLLSEDELFGGFIAKNKKQESEVVKPVKYEPKDVIDETPTNPEPKEVEVVGPLDENTVGDGSEPDTGKLDEVSVDSYANDSVELNDPPKEDVNNVDLAGNSEDKEIFNVIRDSKPKYNNHKGNKKYR